MRRDIEVARRALEPAARPRIHTFLATSDIHLRYKLRIDRTEALARVEEAVALARELCDDVEFSAEDASRTDPDFLCEVFETAVRAGATTLNVPDTVGYAVPDEFEALVRRIVEEVCRDRDVVVSVHCHDDLGLAVANSLAGVRGGARQVEATVNGIGERAGNAALEEVVAALVARADAFGVRTGIDPRRLGPASRLVRRVTGFPIPPNKAVVGDNAFAHEAGIHQAGMLGHRSTYEILRPEDVGARPRGLVLGKHSGRHALAERLARLGHRVEGARLDEVFARFKALAERRKEVTDDDLEELVGAERGRGAAGYRLLGVQVACGVPELSSATVRVEDPEGRIRTAAAVGEGPIQSAFGALERATGIAVRVDDYDVRALGIGADAEGEVTVWLHPRARTAGDGASVGDAPGFVGHGVSRDVVHASCLAYLSALGRLVRAAAPQSRSRRTPASPETARTRAATTPGGWRTLEP